MLIDAHMNITPDGEWLGTRHDASLENALRQLDAADAERGCAIVLPGETHREFGVELAVRHGDRFFVGFTVSELTAKELGRLRELLDQKLVRYLKIHPRWTGIRPDDPGLDPFLELATARGAPAIFCTYMRGLQHPLEELTPLVFDRIARRHPELNMVLGHAGTYRPMDALAVAQTHPNVYMDVSHVFQYFAGSSLIADFTFALDRLDRKMIFGTDFPEVSIPDYAARLRAITDTLEDFGAEGFYAGNALALYGD